MATLVTPAFVRKAASSPRPRLVVGNLFLVMLTSPLGSLIRVAATTLSRCTSRPAALSACCFTPHLLSRRPTARTCVGRWEGTTVDAESGVRARSDTRWSPRPRTRLLSRTRLQELIGDHTQGQYQDFMPRRWPPRSWGLLPPGVPGEHWTAKE